MQSGQQALVESTGIRWPLTACPVCSVRRHRVWRERDGSTNSRLHNRYSSLSSAIQTPYLVPVYELMRENGARVRVLRVRLGSQGQPSPPLASAIISHCLASRETAWHAAVRHLNPNVEEPHLRGLPTPGHWRRAGWPIHKAAAAQAVALPLFTTSVLCGSLVGKRKRVADSSRGGWLRALPLQAGRVPSRWIAGNPPRKRRGGA